MTAPDTPGTYNYDCTYYPETMKGTLIVANVTTPSSAAPATATPTPTATPTSTTGTTGTTSGPTESTSPTPPPPSISPQPPYNPAPGTPGYLKRPEKCSKPEFHQVHAHACAMYGVPAQDTGGSGPAGTDDDSGSDPDQ